MIYDLHFHFFSFVKIPLQSKCFAVHLACHICSSFRRVDLLLLPMWPRCPFARTCLTPAMKQRDSEMSLTAILAASVHLLLFHWVWSNGKQNILIIANHNSLAELSSVCSDQHNSFRAAAGPGICWLHHSPSNIGNNCFSHLLNVSNLKNVFILHWDESKICSCKNLSWAELSAFSRLAWEAEMKCIPYPAMVVNIKLHIQTGTALTEETEKLSNRLVVRPHSCNIRTKSLVWAKTITDICPPQSRLCSFPCESRDGTLLWWPEIHPESEKHFPDANAVKLYAPLCTLILENGNFFSSFLLNCTLLF